MRIIGSQFKKALNTAMIALLAVSLVGCEFQESITPVSWPTVPPQPFQSGAEYGTPAPSPIPLAPSPSPPPPTPIPFQGADDLDCEGPIGGDNRFGYCSIPDSDLYYVWGECTEPCPAGEYPGIEIRVVEDSSEYRDFVSLLGMCSSMLEAKKDSGLWGGGLAFADLVGGGLALQGAKCIVGLKFTFGVSCIGLAITVGAGAAAVVKFGIDYLKADHELNKPGGLNEQVRDRFQQLQPLPQP